MTTTEARTPPVGTHVRAWIYCRICDKVISYHPFVWTGEPINLSATMPSGCEGAFQMQWLEPTPWEAERVDIADFLRARLDEDEAAQRDADASWHDSSCGSVPTRWPSDIGPCDCGIPQRVLADVAAKRAIIQWHSPAKDATHAGTGEPIQICHCGYDLPCTTLRLLAHPYAAHAGYDPEWSPGRWTPGADA